MASVGSLSGNTSSQLYGAKVHGYTGLASGMDIDSLIQDMTYGTRSKIAKQLQSKQTLQWQQEAYRSISSKLIDFNQKYLSLTASGSLYRESTFDRSIVTALGKYSDKVSVSGASDMLDSMTLTSIKQLATTASLATAGSASNGSSLLSTGRLDLTGKVSTENLLNGSMIFTYDGKDYTVNLRDANGDYSNGSNAADAINDALSKVKTADGGNLGEKVRASYDSGAGTFSFENVDPATDKKLTFKNADVKTLAALGFQGVKLGEDNNLGKDDAGTGKTMAGGEAQSIADFLGGKTLTFSLDGKKKVIALPSADDIRAMGGDLNKMKEALQKSLNSAFGNGAVNVTTTAEGGLAFDPANNTSVLKITNASSGLIGEGSVMGIDYGASSRVNLAQSVRDSGLNLPGGFQNSADDKIFVQINGFKKYYDKNTSVGDIIADINNSNAGVKVSYLETADKFLVTSNSSGSLGQIQYDDDDGSGASNLAAALFGSAATTGADAGVKGKDAEFTVRYAGLDRDITITRSSNSFDFEGATFTLKETFNESRGETDPVTDAVSFSSSVDVDNITKSVSEMIDAYNALIEESYKETGKKPDRDYPPLTDEQKADMSEEQIKKWEEKARQGVLYNDSTLNSLNDSLRFIFSGVADVGTLKNMGIVLSEEYSDHGKITFDAEKFKNALKQDSEQVKEFFTKPASENDKGGFMARMSSVYDTFAKTSGYYKGSLIQKAGSEASATSLLENTIQKKIDEIDKTVKELKVKLQKEMNKYNNQFTQLEKLISQMNNQSGMLNSLGGG